MLFAVTAVFFTGLIAPAVTGRLGRFSAVLFSMVPAAAFFLFCSHLGGILNGNFPEQSLAWVSGLDIWIHFRLDGLSLLFCALICGIGALIIPYAAGYLKGDPRLGRFYLFFFMFMGSMLGVVLSDNLLVLFVFWELTSLSSYFLIGFYHGQESSRKSALQALLVTGAGGLAMLAGFLLMGQMGGTMSVSELLLAGQNLSNHPLFEICLILVLAGACTKSAQFPFHFWLPNAMAAPAPVSAYLHSSTMVKAGVYLIARLNPFFADSPLWMPLLTIFGIMTLMTGVILSFRQNDLKKILAYMTVSALGVMVMLIGLGTKQSVQAALLFLLAHAFYKGALFMVAGTVDHAAHCRDPEQLGGLSKKMPLTAFTAALAALSMAGLIPFLGFIGKEWLLEAALHSDFKFIITFAAVLGGGTFAAMALWVAMKPFLGKITEKSSHAHEAPAEMLLGPGVLALCGIIFGVFPQGIKNLIFTSANAVIGSVTPLKITLWHGFNTAFTLSLISLALGAALYCWRIRIRTLMECAGFVLDHGPEKIYDAFLKYLLLFSAFLTRSLQSGRLRFYFRIIISSLVFLAGVTWLLKKGFVSGSHLPLQSIDVFCAGLIIVASIAAVFSRARLTAVLAMGIIGLIISFIFVRFGAPDLAMTQFAVETLTVVLLAFVLYRVPAVGVKSSARTKWIDAAIALPAGLLMAGFAYLGATASPQFPAAAKFYSDNSLALAHGKNIVNVIIVDFRALDTLGEITVVAVAGIGVFTLLKLVICASEKEKVSP